MYHNEALDFWVLSRYADVEGAARRPEIFSSAQGVGPDRQAGASMITQDPPEHTRLRKLVSKAFTPRMVTQLEPRIQAIADELLDAVIDEGAFDLVQDLAYPLPVIVIAEMLGVDPERRDDFKRWSDDVIHIVAAGQNEARMAQYMESWEAFKAYFVGLIEARRHAPREDLVSALVQAQEERDAAHPERASQRLPAAAARGGQRNHHQPDRQRRPGALHACRRGLEGTPASPSSSTA